MRLKMDDPRTGRTKNITMNSTSQYNNSRISNHSLTSETASSSSMLHPSFFLNKDLVHVSKFATLLNGTELLDDNNSDLMSTATLDKYIPQECESNLIQDDLTEEDRRLAATLVAVQFVNQQKQQPGGSILPILSSQSMAAGVTKLTAMPESSMLGLPPLIGPNKSSNPASPLVIPAATVPSMPTYNNHASSAHMMVGNAVHHLPPLKKARSRFDALPHLPSTNIPLESLGIQTEMSAMDMDAADIKQANLEFILPEDSKYTFDSEDSDALNSDYSPSQKSRRQSLPHKKRIPRRLRNPKKAVSGRPARSSSNRRQNSQSLNQNFTCELCLAEFPNQWMFFEHLKSHYEPYQFEPSPTTLRKNDVVQDKEEVVKEKDRIKMEESEGRSPPTPLVNAQLEQCPPAATSPLPPCTAPSAATAATSSQFPILARVLAPSRIVSTTRPYSYDPEPTKTVHSDYGPSTIRTISPSRTNKGKGVSPISRYLEENMINECLSSTNPLTNFELPPAGGAPAVLHQCYVCKRAFRRLKAYEVHIATAHRDPVEEFSDPEDMMEGIRVDVGSDEDDSVPIVREAAVQKDWYQESEIYATEGDLDEMKAAEEDYKFQTHVVSDLGSISINSSNGTPVPNFSEESVLSSESRFCGICKQNFASREECSQHIGESHGEVIKAITRVYTKPPKKKIVKKCVLHCPECNKKFVHRNSYKYHVRSHQGRRPFNCEECGKSFFAKNALKVHLRRHSGLKPYKCDFCSRCFRQWGDLKYHVISIHTNQKNYQCEVCGKDFARKYSLTLHSRIHTGERNYKCEFCEKTFRASSYLKNHRKIHTGEKPYKCDLCDRYFRVKSDMNRHRQTHRDHLSSSCKRRSNPPNNSPHNGSTSEPTTVSVYQDKQSKQVFTSNVMNLNEMCKVEDYDNSGAVEGILSVDDVRGEQRLHGLGGAFPTTAVREVVVDGHKEENGMYYWPVFQAT